MHLNLEFVQKIQCRGFLPSGGRITEYSEPPKNANIRVDTGFGLGGEVSMFYDSMIAKLCTYERN